MVEYLKDENLFGRLLLTVGRLPFAFEIVVIVANFFLPVLYSFEGGVYRAGAARYITLAIQIVMFLMTTAYALAMAIRSDGTMRLRHRTIALFSLFMTGFITAQALYPLLPLYAIGCMLGTCLLHTFVLENEKEDYRDQLETQLQESILNGNYYDLLTGLPGMSYFFRLSEKHKALAVKRGSRLACLYLNLSGMKFYNKNHGFSGGDKLLQSLARLLTGAFGEENCSRFGQDHFAVIAEEAGLEDKLNRLFEDWQAQYGEESLSILAGIYLDDPRNVDISTACDLAKIACDAIHTTYKSSYKYYDNAMLAVAEKQQYIIGHLDRALAPRWRHDRSRRGSSLALQRDARPFPHERTSLAVCHTAQDHSGDLPPSRDNREYSHRWRHHPASDTSSQRWTDLAPQDSATGRISRNPRCPRSIDSS